MGRALAVVCAAVACAVAAGAGANEPIAPNELGLTAIDCATQYCTSKDSLLLWLALENTCFSDKQPCAAGRRQRSSSSKWRLHPDVSFDCRMLCSRGVIGGSIPACGAAL